MLDVLALACAIQRTKGKYTNAITVTGGEVQDYTNKDVLYFFLIPGTSPAGYIPNVKLTDEDRQQANDIIRFYRKLTFGVLAENINDYLKNVSRVLGTNDCTQKDFGIISAIPATYLRDSDRAKKDKLIKETDGTIFGEVGQSVEMVLYMVDIRYVEKIECYSHTAINSDGCLVEFLNKKQVTFEGESVRVKARVKGHGNHFHTKKPLTQLNYVKVVDNLVI